MIWSHSFANSSFFMFTRNCYPPLNFVTFSAVKNSFLSSHLSRVLTNHRHLPVPPVPPIIYHTYRFPNPLNTVLHRILIARPASQSLLSYITNAFVSYPNAPPMTINRHRFLIPSPFPWRPRLKILTVPLKLSNSLSFKKSLRFS